MFQGTPKLKYPVQLLIMSATDGQRVRAQIRHGREQTRRRVADLVASVKATLKEADEVLARVAPSKDA